MNINVSGAKIIVLILIVVGLVGGYLLMSVSYQDSYVEKVASVEAKQQECVIVHDNTWKVIKQLAQVPERAAGKFAEIYPKLMQGRYGNARGGALMSWVTEQNPDFKPIGDLYSKLSNAIEGNRATLVRKETELLQLKKSHDVFVGKVFTKHFIGQKDKIEVQVIASSRSNKAFETGVDDDTDVFGGN